MRLLRGLPECYPPCALSEQKFSNPDRYEPLPPSQAHHQNSLHQVPGCSWETGHNTLLSGPLWLLSACTASGALPYLLSLSFLSEARAGAGALCRGREAPPPGRVGALRQVPEASPGRALLREAGCLGSKKVLIFSKAKQLPRHEALKARKKNCEQRSSSRSRL